MPLIINNAIDMHVSIFGDIGGPHKWGVSIVGGKVGDMPITNR